MQRKALYVALFFSALFRENCSDNNLKDSDIHRSVPQLRRHLRGLKEDRSPELRRLLLCLRATGREALATIARSCSTLRQISL